MGLTVGKQLQLVSPVRLHVWNCTDLRYTRNALPARAVAGSAGCPGICWVTHANEFFGCHGRDCTNCAGWLIQPKHHVGLTLLPPPVSQPNHPDPCWARFSAAAAAAFFLFSRSTYMTQTQSEGRTQ